MPKRILSRQARLIPNFNMTKPWSTPISPQESEALASSALLASGVSDNETSITTLLREFSGDYVQQLANANSQTRTS
jgi:hypothetical protein